AAGAPNYTGGSTETTRGAPITPKERKGRKKGRWTNGRWTNGRWTNGRARNGRTTAGRLTTCPPPAPPRNPSARAAVGVSARLAVSVREAVVTIGPLFMASSLLLRR